ncbi:MAG: adenylyl-sulfate kinase [Silvibacterium sp.]|nr:adenylyl-sulfate kinase [Silvibacterium sp.]
MGTQVCRYARSSGLTVWLTGLSGAGKTTLAAAVCEDLRNKRRSVEVLDADVVRTHLWKELGFSKPDRDENVRRLAWVSQLLNRNGITTLVAAIAPYRDVRAEVRASCANFLEVYVNAPLDVCEQRDPKGHYRRARGGQLSQFTGVADPYEPPFQPDVECRTDKETLAESSAKIVSAIEAWFDSSREDAFTAGLLSLARALGA